MLRSRKSIEAQLKAKKELEEKQRRREEEQRQEAERRLREQLENERLEKELQAERKVRESQLRIKQIEVFRSISDYCKRQVAEEDGKQWEERKFQWCMRCDGLPDPLNLPQLNTYKYRWSQSSCEKESSVSDLTSRMPELIQVLKDLDKLLEDPHDLTCNFTQQLLEMRLDLARLMMNEIDMTIFEILRDVQVHLPAEETVLVLQNCAKSFSIALGCDTSRNSSVRNYNFSQMGIKISLPSTIIGACERPLAISLIWLLDIHQLEPPNVNAVQNLPNLLKIGYLKPSPDGVAKPKQEDVDLDVVLITAGCLHVDLLEVPVQPKKIASYTIAPWYEKKAKRYSYKASLNAALDLQTPGEEQKQESDNQDREAKELEEELGKLITITLKLPNWCLWLEPPKPVRYTSDGWTFSGIWDVRFQEQIGGPSLHFRLEEPSIIGLSQARRVNLPIQGWTLFPGHVSRSQWTTKNKPLLENPLDKHVTDNPPGNTGEGATGTSKWESGGGWDAGDLESLDDDEDPQQAELEQHVCDRNEDELFDEEDNVAILSVNGALATFDIEIRETDVRLRLVRTSNSSNVQDLIGKPTTPYELIKALRHRGLEISPSKKVSAKVEDLPLKEENLELATYQSIAMALASKSFAFFWSRWNITAGRCGFIFQLHSLESKTPVSITINPPISTLRTFMLKTAAQLVQVTQDRVRLLPFQEMSQSFEEVDLSQIDSKFYIDLYNALLEENPDNVKDRLRNVSPLFVNNIYTMMASLRLLSTG